jgi:hypothetical protein
LELKLSPGNPNPFTVRTVLKYQIPQDEIAKLSVFDLRGRLVRTLVKRGPQIPGEYTAVWDGRDDAGGIERPGLYWARLDAGGRQLVQKLVLTQ